MNIRQGYLYAKQKLEQAGSEEAEAESKEIVASLLGCSYGELPLHYGEACPARLEEILQKRLSGMPLAYALREKHFYGLPFYVDERVLIPRYDTEILAEAALDYIKNRPLRVLDLCCGSGCIGITLAKQSAAQVVLSDVSEDALAVARINAQKHGVCVELIHGDLFDKIDGKFDLIVSNPPYVTEEEYACLEAQVRDFEPRMALVGGLAYYRRIANEAKKFLKDGGALMLEIGCAQKEDVFKLLTGAAFKNIRCVKDLAQRDRVILCTKN